MSQDTSPEKTAELIIDFLHTRKNFYYWWDNIDQETKNEILEGLAGVILSNTCIHEWTIDGCAKCGKGVS